MTGRAGAHAATDRRHAVVELAQVLHHLEARLGFHLVLNSIAIHDPQERHLSPTPEVKENRMVCSESARDLVVCRFALRPARGARCASLRPAAGDRAPSSQTRPCHLRLTESRTWSAAPRAAPALPHRMARISACSYCSSRLAAHRHG